MTRGAAVMDVVVWLRSLGLGRYEAAFRENEINDTIRPTVTAENLKDLEQISRLTRDRPSAANWRHFIEIGSASDFF